MLYNILILLSKFKLCKPHKDVLKRTLSVKKKTHNE